MPNIQFNYLYRDGANYKNFNEVVFSNPDALNIEEVKLQIIECLIDDEWFDATKWQVKDLHFEKWDREVDHEYHEFESIEYTDLAPTDTRTVKQFLKGISSVTQYF